MACGSGKASAAADAGVVPPVDGEEATVAVTHGAAARPPLGLWRGPLVGLDLSKLLFPPLPAIVIAHGITEASMVMEPSEVIRRQSNLRGLNRSIGV